MSQLPFMPGQPPTPEPKPLTWGQRLAIAVEDVAIVLALVILMVLVFVQPKSILWKALMYVTLVAMILVAFRRFRRIKKSSEPTEKP